MISTYVEHVPSTHCLSHTDCSLVLRLCRPHVCLAAGTWEGARVTATALEAMVVLCVLDGKSPRSYIVQLAPALRQAGNKRSMVPECDVTVALAISHVKSSQALLKLVRHKLE